MPHLANLMIPDSENNHPLSAHSFAAAIALVISGDFTNQQGIDYLNSVITRQGGSALSSDAIGELATIKSNFDAKTNAQKQLYFIKLSQYSIACEEAADSGITPSDFDLFLEI